MGRGDEGRYRDRIERLEPAGVPVWRRAIRARFAGTHQHLYRAGPGGGVDLSSIDDGDLALQAAAQSVCWSYGSLTVSAAKHLADAGLAPQRHYFMVMDELWRMLRAAPFMVDFVDALTRLNRNRGLGQAMITHTMDDLKLPSETDTVKAWGFLERSAMVFCPEGVVRLSGLTSLSAGLYHTCSIVAGGLVNCWGYGTYGQLGNGDTISSPLPVEVLPSS